MTPERFQTLRRVLSHRQADLTVLMDNVHKPHNVSAVLRTCDAVGVLEAHAVWPNPRLRPLGSTSSGAGKWVRVHTHPDTAAAVNALRQRGFQIVTANHTPDAMDYREVNYTRACALVLGAELQGVSGDAIALTDVEVVIPMQGMVESLNVSVAAAIILFEAQRQRLARGRYRRCTLDAATYRRTLFEWAHPRVADYCQRHGLEYPSLGADGEIASEFRPLV